ncbi:exonuclease RecJ [Haloplanus sp.]|uniref:exonuclease RecJ n=1 Tax=Haloplanus sp. TaxID=1961696 RepID=UPI0026145D32|nr:exonuclease RecJ [Haloplanus sp.]
MATAPATTDTDADAGEVAAALRDAPFVRVVAAANGDSLAASGVLARALRTVAVPFQIRVDPIPDPASTMANGEDFVLGVGPGATGGDHGIGGARPASLAAAEVVRALGLDPDPVLALAGVAAAGHPVDAGDAAALLDAASRQTTVERRPGVAAPTADPADCLAHSTLVHASVSGDPEAARATLESLEYPADPADDDRRRLASWLAVESTASSARAVDAVERGLRPYATPDGRFATVAGFGDVLDAVARERPGTGVALAVRDGDNDDTTRTAVVEAWRTHARAVHTAVAEATTGRYDGVLAVRVDTDADPGRLGTVARLCRDFRSPEPVVLVVADRAAAAAAPGDADIGCATAEAVRAVEAGGKSAGDAQRATAGFDDNVAVSRFITAFREAL